MKQTNKLKLHDLEDKILFTLKDLCSSVPFLTLRSWRQEKTSGGYRPDIVLAMNVGDRHWEWLVECRLNGQPRELRGVIPLMKSALAEPGAHIMRGRSCQRAIWHARRKMARRRLCACV